MKLVCMADLHGHLPDGDSVQGDVAVIAGDIVPLWATNGRMRDNLYNQAKWLMTDFYPWVESVQCDRVVLTWGNHDWIGMEPTVIPKYRGDKLVTLVDQGTAIDGVHFWGTPWQPRFHDWAFNLDENDLKRRWKMIPADTNVLVVHGPPHGYGDRVGSVNVGSPSLAQRMRELGPSVVVCGHIHVGRGHYQAITKADKTVNILNCSIVDNKYNPVHEPVEWEVEQ